MTANYIYTIAGNGVQTFSGDGGPATAASLNHPYATSLDAGGNIYIADADNNRIRFIAKTSGTYFGQSMTANYIYTIAGDGTASFGGNGGFATSAQLNFPQSVIVDAGGNVIIGDAVNYRVRIIAKTSGTYFGQSMNANCIYTIAGNGTASYGGDGGPATSGILRSPPA